jgi:hypothetical protein
MDISKVLLVLMEGSYDEFTIINKVEKNKHHFGY